MEIFSYVPVMIFCIVLIVCYRLFNTERPGKSFVYIYIGFLFSITSMVLMMSILTQKAIFEDFAIEVVMICIMAIPASAFLYFCIACVKYIFKKH